jgi:hypothetical protein
MNDRIEQLAEQCWVHTNEPLFAAKSPHWEFDRQKFAELIVRECIDTVSDCSIEYCTRPQIVNELKEHFGVKE